MTVTYTAEVANSSWGCFIKLLFRWKGSVYKLLWKELLVFLGLFYLLNLIYRFGLKGYPKEVFESIVVYCDSFSNLIPVAFVLGFYVSIICTRWWDQFNSIPWPDRTALFVTALLHGQDERPRLMRRTIMRYLVLSFTMTLSSISTSVKKRFPTLDHMREAGLMLEGEQKIIEHLKTQHSKYFVPLVWATSLVSRARKEGLIKDDFAVKTIIDEINRYRSDLGTLYNYDWVNIPMVYTQVVTLAVYTFFLSCLMGRQFIDKTDFEARRPDMYFPLFTLLQFFFYMGWLKVAESMINPFGDDDDDFEINTTIDRNIQVSYLIVDEMHSEFPELIRDAYWDETEFQMPYTQAAVKNRTEPHLGSAADIQISAKQADFVPLSTIREEGSSLKGSETVASQSVAAPSQIDVPSDNDSQSTFSRGGSKRKKYFRKPKGTRTTNRRTSSGASAEIVPPQTGRGSLSSANSVTVQISPASPEKGVKNDTFVMPDLDSSSEDNLSQPPSKKEQTLDKTPNGPASGDCPDRESANRLSPNNLHQTDTNIHPGQLIPSESETSLSKTQKYLAEIPLDLIIKTGPELEEENTFL